MAGSGGAPTLADVAALGDDLLVLLAAQGPSVRSVRQISPLSSPLWTRAAFRIERADGSVLKGRRFESTAAAARFLALAPLLPAGPFPQVLAHKGCAVLLEWIDGVPSNPSVAPPMAGAMAPELFGELGTILRSVHDTRVEHPWPGAPQTYPGPRWRDRLAARLGRLHRAGVVTRDESTALLETAESYEPPEARVGLVIGDLAPENIVAGSDGAPRVIDTDGLDLHVPPFDFVRLWYRWPMTPSQWHALEEGHGAGDMFAAYRDHFAHWAVVALTAAADFRLRHGLPDALAPVHRLRQSRVSG